GPHPSTPKHPMPPLTTTIESASTTSASLETNNASSTMNASSTPSSIVDSLILEVKAIQDKKGFISKETKVNLLTNLELLKSQLELTTVIDYEPAAQLTLEQDNNFATVGSIEASRMVTNILSNQRGDQVRVSRGLLLRMSSLLFADTESEDNTVANLVHSHLATMDRVEGLLQE